MREYLLLGMKIKGCSPERHWSYYVFTLPQGQGFQYRIERYKGNGQPWSVVQGRLPPTDFEAALHPLLGTRSTKVKQTHCITCRVHVSPDLSISEDWILGVFGVGGPCAQMHVYTRANCVFSWMCVYAVHWCLCRGRLSHSAGVDPFCTQIDKSYKQWPLPEH